MMGRLVGSGGGRLVTSISREEFGELPKWRQWINNHWVVVMLMPFVVLAGIIALIRAV